MTALLIVGAIVIVYSAASGPLAKLGVTSAMAFVAAGLLTGAAGLGWLDVPLRSPVVERLTELALVFLLFSDSARIDLRSLRHSLGWPSRLLLIGLPLTLLTGLGVGLLVWPGLAVASVFLLSTMLCSTDAALGAASGGGPCSPCPGASGPGRRKWAERRSSGAVFLVAIELSLAKLSGGVSSAVISNIAAQIGWGLLAGIGAGAVGGFVFRAADRRRWLQTQWRQSFTFAVALCAYAAAGALGGSGFIAAFTAGMAFGAVSRPEGLHTTYLTEEAGNILAAVVWTGFGALAISQAWPEITWRVVLYAILSLTVVRMVPVAVAMTGSGARWQTVAFMGWFGPRGLASVVFGLLALESHVPHARTLLATVVVTVGLSVFVHGLTAGPFVAAYHRWYTVQATSDPSSPEAKPTILPRPRHRTGPDDASQKRRQRIPLGRPRDALDGATVAGRVTIWRRRRVAAPSAQPTGSIQDLP